MDYLWLIILFAVLAALPDLLRKKRRYPRRTDPHQGPMGREAQHEAETPLPIEKDTEPIPETMETKPIPTYIPEPENPVVLAPVAEAMQVIPVHPQQTVPGWTELDPAAQQIYAGIVWSELLQPPVSCRRR